MRWAGHCWRLLIVAIIAGVAAFFLLYLPISEADKAEGVRQIVGWIAQDHALPGFTDRYPDARLMAKQKWFVVKCAFVAPEVVLSADQRVVRHEPPNSRKPDEHRGYDGGTDYLTIAVVSETFFSVTFQVDNYFGPLAAHGYRFVMSKRPWGIRFQGTMQYVS